MHLEGIHVAPIRTLLGDSVFNEVHFDSVHLAADSLLGELDGGWNIVTDVLRDERGPEFALDRFAEIRRMFEELLRVHREMGSVDQYLGHEYARLSAIPLIAQDLLIRLDTQNLRTGLESMAKLYTTECWRALGDAMVTETDHRSVTGPAQLERLLESRHFTISAGTSQIQRNNISRQVLRLPSSRTGPDIPPEDGEEMKFLDDGWTHDAGQVLSTWERLVTNLDENLDDDGHATPEVVQASLAAIADAGWEELRVEDDFVIEALRRAHRRSVPLSVPLVATWFGERLADLQGRDPTGVAISIGALTEAIEDRDPVKDLKVTTVYPGVFDTLVPVRRGSVIDIYEIPRGAAVWSVDTSPDPTVDLRTAIFPAFHDAPLALRKVGELEQHDAEHLTAGVLLAQAAAVLGQAETLFTRTLAYIRTRKQFEVPVGSFQALKHRAADLAVDVYASDRVLAHGHQCWQKRVDPLMYGAHAKAMAGRAALAVASEAIQFHGGLGFTWEGGVHLGYKRIIHHLQQGWSVGRCERELAHAIATDSEIGWPTAL